MRGAQTIRIAQHNTSVSQTLPNTHAITWKSLRSRAKRSSSATTSIYYNTPRAHHACNNTWKSLRSRAKRSSVEKSSLPKKAMKHTKPIVTSSAYLEI